MSSNKNKKQKENRSMQSEKSNAIIDLLQTHRAGGSIFDLSAKLTELVQAVRDTGSPGTLTLVLKLKPGPTIGSLIVEDKSRLFLPQPEVAKSIFFASEDNQLRRNDPSQKEFELRTVPDIKSDAPLKEVAAQ